MIKFFAKIKIVHKLIPSILGFIFLDNQIKRD